MCINQGMMNCTLQYTYCNAFCAYNGLVFHLFQLHITVDTKLITLTLILLTWRIW